MNKEFPNFSDIHLQAQDYWGPNRNKVFEQFKNLPFAPFNKLDKVSKYCDFESKAVENFIQVESKPKTTQPAYQRYRRQQFQRAYQNQFQEQEQQVNQGYKKQKQPKQKVQNRYNYYQRPVYHKTKFKDNTILTQSWKVIGEISKGAFDVKTNQVGSIKLKDLFKVGIVKQYNKKFDKLKTIKAKPIFALEKQAIANLPFEQDEYLKSLSDKLRELNKNIDSLQKPEEPESPSINKELAYLQQPMVFTSDTVLSAIMALQHSNFPFEILVRKEGNQLIMDKSTNPTNFFNSYIDLMSANENVVNIPEDEKEIVKQCIESTLIHHTLPSVVFNQQGETEFSIQLPEEDILSSFLKKLPTTGFSERQMLYKYRHISIENKQNVFIRCSTNGEVDGNEFLLLTLNEFTPDIQQWKQNLEQKQGLILMEELRSNIYKATRWICQGLLSGVKFFKLAFVAKETDKSYQLLLVETYKIEELMKMLNFREKDCWYYVKQIIEFISKQQDGSYVLKKPPFSQKFEVYKQEKDEVDWDQEKDK